MGLDNLTDEDFWQPIKDFEDRYLISKEGEIYSKYAHKVMKFDYTKDG